jgi:hypothetical protein
MIEHSRLAKSGNCYRLANRMTNAAIDEMFRKVRTSHPSASKTYFGTSGFDDAALVGPLFPSFTSVR